LSHIETLGAKRKTIAASKRMDEESGGCAYSLTNPATEPAAAAATADPAAHAYAATARLPPKKSDKKKAKLSVATATPTSLDTSAPSGGTIDLGAATSQSGDGSASFTTPSFSEGTPSLSEGAHALATINLINMVNHKRRCFSPSIPLPLVTPYLVSGSPAASCFHHAAGHQPSLGPRQSSLGQYQSSIGQWCVTMIAFC
jgi:hypothetical protein